jgi:hypothetical protein
VFCQCLFFFSIDTAGSRERGKEEEREGVAAAAAERVDGMAKMHHHATETPYPCVWVTLHWLARKVDSKWHANMSKQGRFAHLVMHLESLFDCDECREHMGDYIKRHPLPQPAMRRTNGWEYSRWMVQFHNSRNRADGKPEMTLVEALELYAFPSLGGGCPVGVACRVQHAARAPVAPRVQLAEGGGGVSVQPRPAVDPPPSPFGIAAGAFGVATVVLGLAALGQ